ncbi:MAG: hypothetical protein D6160_21150 [Ketobacter sp.]|nr:MAG: hypothetical protein D6160_21150 [Ketobacter sp.]
MKRAFICLLISLTISCLGLLYLVVFVAKDNCLDSGGRWIGVVKGCEGGNEYSLSLLLSPLPVCIFIGIVLGISSVLIQLHTLIFDTKKQSAVQQNPDTGTERSSGP